MFRVVPKTSLNLFKYVKQAIHPRNLSVSTRVFKQESDDNGPIKYSESPASKHKAQWSRTGVHDEPRLWYEPYVIIVSVSIFMIYFTILREENDIDEELGKSLYSRIDGLEEFQLKQALQYNQQQGQSTVEIEKRLEAIEKEKTKKSN